MSVRRLEGPSGDAMELGKTLRLASRRWKIGDKLTDRDGATCFLEKKEGNV